MAITRQIRRSHYWVLGLVGYGQFGRVYGAIHRKTGELVALKDLHKDRFPTHKFLRELRFLISLEHPNIVTCHALEHSTSGRQLVLDYCEGGTLRSILDSDMVLSLEEVLGFLLDILAALDHAHQQGIVHCDIKPENILLQLTPGGWTARISDFGIARLSQESTEAELGATGSPAYMAPERFYNQHPVASDLYAVGIIFYELLLGQRPFSGTPAELMIAHLNQVPEVPLAVPNPLREILLKSLQKLLPKRFHSAQEMRQELVKIYQQCQQGDLPARVREQPLPSVRSVKVLPFVAMLHPITVMGLATLPSPSNQNDSEAAVHLLITCHGQNVWFYHWPDRALESPMATQGFTLPASVQRFVAIPQGGVLITPSSLHLLSMTHGLGRITHEDSPMQAGIAPNGRWFVTCSDLGDLSQIELVVRQLTIQPGLPIKISLPKRVLIPTQGGEFVTFLSLDNGHMALVLRQRYRTVFHVVTRRGHYLGALSVAVPLHHLVATSRPYRYMGLEVGSPQAVLIFDLKPFRIVRYRVDIAARWLFETAQGYGLVDPSGNSTWINQEGQITHRLTGLPCPTTVTQVTPGQYLWGVPEGEGSRLHSVDLTTLGLEIAP